MPKLTMVGESPAITTIGTTWEDISMNFFDGLLVMVAPPKFLWIGHRLENLKSKHPNSIGILYCQDRHLY